MGPRRVELLAWALMAGCAAAARHSGGSCVCTTQTVILAKLDAALGQLEDLEKSADPGGNGGFEKAGQCNKGCTRSCDGSCDTKSKKKGHPGGSCDSSCDSGCNGCSTSHNSHPPKKDDGKAAAEKQRHDADLAKLKAELEHEKSANAALRQEIKDGENAMKQFDKDRLETLKTIDSQRAEIHDSHAARAELAHQLAQKRAAASKLQAEIKSLRDQIKSADKCPCAADLVAEADAVLARHAAEHGVQRALALGAAGTVMVGAAVFLRARAHRRRVARELL